MSTIIKLKGNIFNENPPATIGERELVINEVSGKLYARRIDLDESTARNVCIGGNDKTIMYSDPSPIDNEETYLILSATENIEIREILFLVQEGALTNIKLRKRIYNQPLTEGSGYYTIATFNANTNFQTVQIFNDAETEANPENRYILEGEGLFLESGIGSSPVNFTLQINYRILGGESYGIST